MSPQRTVLDFLLREWLLLSVTAAMAATSLYLGRMPTFSREDLEILFILATLFVVVKGLEKSNLLLRLSQRFARGRLLPLKLVGLSFFLSMVITNDVALLVIVPLTLAHGRRDRDLLVILEALAVNAGSALTPIGNPQNLFIFWHYGLDIRTFITAIAPFSLMFLVILGLAGLLLGMRTRPLARQEPSSCQPVRPTAVAYIVLLLAIILVILRQLPTQAGIIILVLALLIDRRCLRIDYILLLTLACFFGLAENIKHMLAASIAHSEHVFLFSALASQVISNVPAALLFGRFTDNWHALLWGTSTGGFGSLVGSLANLIAYRLYITDVTTDNPAAFAARFTILGYLAFFAALGLYFALRP